MYHAPTSAGDYRGGLGRTYRRVRHPRVARQGARARSVMEQRALQGLGGLGDACSSTEARIAQALIGGTGAIIGAVGQAQREPIFDPFTGKITGYREPDAGYAIGSASANTVSNIWGAACATPQGADSDVDAAEIERMLAEERARNEAAIRDAQRSQSEAISSLATAMAAGAQRPPSPGIDTNTLLIAGGIGLAALVAVALVLK